MEQLPEAGDRYFEAVLKVIKDNIGKMVEDQEEKRFYESLITGGITTAAHVVIYCEAMKKLYGEGDADKALELGKLFSLLMLAQSYRWLRENHPGSGNIEDAARIAATNVLAMFGDSKETSLELFSNIKKQFDYDTDKNPNMVHTGGLMLGWAAEAMGHKCLEWQKIKFPVHSMTQVTRPGILIDSSPMRSPADIKTFWACHGTGCRALMKYYESKKTDEGPAPDNSEPD